MARGLRMAAGEIMADKLAMDGAAMGAQVGRSAPEIERKVESQIEAGTQAKKQAENLAEAETQAELMAALLEQVALFRGLQRSDLAAALQGERLVAEKLYSSRPVYTAFRPGSSLNFLYGILSGGPVIVRSTPLDRIIAMTYGGSCFGMQNLAFGYGLVSQGFPSQVEAYKTTDIVKIPVAAVERLYQQDGGFRDRYALLFGLRDKFQYHLLNCSTYPPQAVASLLRALVYQERSWEYSPRRMGFFVLICRWI